MESEPSFAGIFFAFVFALQLVAFGMYASAWLARQAGRRAATRRGRKRVLLCILLAGILVAAPLLAVPLLWIYKLTLAIMAFVTVVGPGCTGFAFGVTEREEDLRHEREWRTNEWLMDWAAERFEGSAPPKE